MPGRRETCLGAIRPGLYPGPDLESHSAGPYPTPPGTGAPVGAGRQPRRSAGASVGAWRGGQNGGRTAPPAPAYRLGGQIIKTSAP